MVVSHSDEAAIDLSCPPEGQFPSPTQFQKGLGLGPAVAIYIAVLMVLFFNFTLFIIQVRKFLKEVPTVQVPNQCWVVSLFTGISFFVTLMVFLPTATEFLLAAYKVYEAIVICRFVELNLMWFGGEKKLLNNLGENPIMRFNLPPCCCWFLRLRRTLLTRKRLKFARFCVNQMVYVQTFTIFMQLVLTFVGFHDGPLSPSNPHTYFKLVGRISFFFGLWSLFVFLTIERTFKLLNGHKYIEKFTVMKVTLILFIIQETLFETLAANGWIGCTPYLSGSAWGLNIINCSLLMVECTLLGPASFYFYFRYPRITYESEKLGIELPE